MAKYYEIKRLVLNTTQWKPVTAPIHTSRLVLRNEDDTNIHDVRTDPDDADTQRFLLPGADMVVQSPVATWEAGAVICYVRAQAGAGPVVAEFTR
ncbi:MAG TPA: hypothetical protein VEA16_21990 [Vicinamibacterales bacterium]|nr:hypothetical protein [Vicinamibacterales bacterium]